MRITPWMFAYLLLIATCSTLGCQCYPNPLHRLFNDYRVPSPTDTFLFSEQKDVFLPEQFQPVIQRFKVITEAITILSDEGRNTVAVIDFVDTHFLVQADLKPHFHFSPLMTLGIKEHVTLVECQLVDNPPDYIIITDQAPTTTSPGIRATEAYDRIMVKVNERFTEIGGVSDMKVFKHNQ